MRQWIIGLTIGLGLASGAAAELDDDKIVLCATTSVRDCLAGSECMSVEPEAVGAPTFMRINLKKQEIVIRPSQPATRIERMEDVEERVILQGAEDGSPERPDGVGWTLSISKETGRFIAAIVGLDSGILMFGACTEI